MCRSFKGIGVNYATNKKSSSRVLSLLAQGLGWDPSLMGGHDVLYGTVKRFPETDFVPCLVFLIGFVALRPHVQDPMGGMGKKPDKTQQ